ncbi:MAG: hypothetical protein ACU841_09650 [Gammaproteobacteria bacterium]
MKKIIMTTVISAALLAPSISQAKNFCYSGGGALFRLILNGKCLGKGKERYSPVVGKVVASGGTITVPIWGSCISRKGRLQLSLITGPVPGGVPAMLTVEGTVPNSDLTGGFDNAPFGDPQTPITMTSITCADLEAGVTPFSQGSSASASGNSTQGTTGFGMPDAR